MNYYCKRVYDIGSTSNQFLKKRRLERCHDFQENDALSNATQKNEMQNNEIRKSETKLNYVMANSAFLPFGFGIRFTNRILQNPRKIEGSFDDFRSSKIKYRK
jgi:hypothetical protein